MIPASKPCWRIVVFRLLPDGFSNRDLRAHWRLSSASPPESMTAGQMTYDLRRLRLHGLIERIPDTHRYQTTDFGLRVAFFFSRTYNRLLRPGLAVLCDAQAPAPAPAPIRRHFDRLGPDMPTSSTRRDSPRET